MTSQMQALEQVQVQAVHTWPVLLEAPCTSFPTPLPGGSPMSLLALALVLLLVLLVAERAQALLNYYLLCLLDLATAMGAKAAVHCGRLPMKTTRSGMMILLCQLMTRSTRRNVLSLKPFVSEPP